MPIPQHVAFTVAHLPTTEFKHRAPLWWAVVLTIGIEGTVMALLLATLLYLRLHEATWPPWGWSAPKTLYGTITTVVILLSAWPMRRIDVEARRLDHRKVNRMLVLFFAISAALLVSRSVEFLGLQVKWDSNAYGSIVWGTLAYHTLHILATVVETGIMAAYVFTHDLDKKHALDLHVTAVYWYFVVLSWIPCYVLLYFGPYLLD
jgi:heme/copper-type cytochrome/quinol oxidase subunit 3